jgi:hypothetical protein
MNSNFDLNIQNYTLKEFEDIFELSNNYDESIVEIQETKLRQNILNDINIIPITKKNTLTFITQVKNILIDNTKKNSNQQINVNYNLDNTNLDNTNLDKNLHQSKIIDAGSTNIIQQQQTPYGNTMPSDFFKGSINPLEKRILKKNINIDTRFRNNYYTSPASNFHIDLPLRLNEVVSMQLSALEFPNTLYVISKTFGNNFFTLEIPDNDSQLVTIPDGNYDYIALQNYINAFLTNLSNSYSNIQFIADINTPNASGPLAGSGKMIVTGTEAFSINFLTDRDGNDDRINPLPLKLGWLMGFREGYYENALNYVSEGVINLLGPRYVYLVVDDFNNSVNDGFYAAFSSSILNKNILARISLEGSVFNYLSKDNFNLMTGSRQYFGPVDIQKLQIQLLDEYGRILDLNNMDYSFCLTFQTIYHL